MKCSSSNLFPLNSLLLKLQEFKNKVKCPVWMVLHVQITFSIKKKMTPIKLFSVQKSFFSLPLFVNR